jgi:hypothetical protein
MRTRSSAKLLIVDQIGRVLLFILSIRTARSQARTIGQRRAAASRRARVLNRRLVESWLRKRGFEGKAWVTLSTNANYSCCQC